MLHAGQSLDLKMQEHAHLRAAAGHGFNMSCAPVPSAAKAAEAAVASAHLTLLLSATLNTPFLSRGFRPSRVYLNLRHKEINLNSGESSWLSRHGCVVTDLLQLSS